MAHLRQAGAVEGDLAERPRRRRERAGKRARWLGRAAIVLVDVAGAVTRQQRVRTLDGLDPLVRQCVQVIRAQQVQGRHGVEGEVRQRLMALALAQLGRAALPPHRFADHQRLTLPAIVLAQEVLPRGNDARRVAPQLAHVQEAQAFGAVLERFPQRHRALAPDGHEHRGVAFEGARERLDHAFQEAAVSARVEQSLMAEAPVPDSGPGTLPRRCDGWTRLHA